MSDMHVPKRVALDADNTRVPRRPSWGRTTQASLLRATMCAAIMLFLPPLVLYVWLACRHYGGTLWGPLAALVHSRTTREALLAQLPRLTWDGSMVLLGWVACQAVLMVCLPGRVYNGPLTPSGHILRYKINGLYAWMVSHAVLLAAVALDVFPATSVYNSWGDLWVMANIFGFLLAIFAYIKGLMAPTNSDVQRTGNFFCDFFMGLELNPRLGSFDLKLFFNGRPGIVAWTAINLSCAAKQYELHGTVTNAMLLLNLLQALYVLDFFWGERWYLTTLDIKHEHFGWLLCWGDCVWLPFMYTLQGFYLVQNPVVLPPAAFVGILLLGLAGYGIFRSANGQRDAFRRAWAQGESPPLIWRQPATYLLAPYTTSDDRIHPNALLTSGWWGLARHANYLGDLLLSMAFCLTCGFGSALPYFYTVYMGILLVHRCYRDEEACRRKYGAVWDAYCQRVPYRLVPGVF